MSTPSTSLPPNAPMTNGVASGHGEADVTATENSQIDSGGASSLQNVCAGLHAQVQAFLSSSPPDEVTKRTQDQTRTAMGVVEKALRDYQFEHVSLSYNGGKDCLVLLILYLSVLHAHFTQQQQLPAAKNNSRKTNSEAEIPLQPFPQSIPSIYAKPPDPFPAVTSFVEYSARVYHLDLAHISTNPGPNKKQRSHSNPPLTHPPPKFNDLQQNHDLPEAKPTISFRDAFALYLDANPQVHAIFVGTRRTDPHGGHLTHFDATDHNWPTFMRVHPVIDWHLEEIWCFLRSPYLKDLEDGGPLRYCAMYDEGYTSLGGVNDTVRNPRLKYHDEKGEERYRPAYEMKHDEGERLGRE
ncbi:uncharacterized protein A1O9_10907 [Exophiala aquamarina CBS 119918]|uniref:FAD synthase n=1 Tax=Exophiala aquamarina CBS 119918 TaxID=1182545 RepID=A0A072NYQ1_9EURO|nr:uncharacterized protein A1O9_10907 [Exophiala aquamarina CBS 119918]KEF52999.1 hypothetical protein A1O9_10907 [Exophiala aquamarina CBS 119918]